MSLVAGVKEESTLEASGMNTNYKKENVTKSMRITEIAFTGLPVTDMKRARDFYEKSLGLKPTLEAAEGLWVEYDLGDSTFGIAGYDKTWKPSGDGTRLALEVEDFDNAISTLQSKKANFALGPIETPVCHIAVITDPDGNKILIHKRKNL